jgi:hypothetical protein
MTGSAIYVCAGCRETFRFVSEPPEGDVTGLTCPAQECGRPVWATSGPHGFEMVTTMVPDLSAGRYCVDMNRVLDHGQELIALMSGPADAPARLCRELEDAGLEDYQVAAHVRDFIQRTGGTWGPGPALIRSGLLATERALKGAADD